MTGKPVHQDTVSALPVDEGDAPAGRAAVGEETDGAAGRIDQLRLGREQANLALAGQLAGGVAADDGITPGLDVDGERDFIVQRDRPASGMTQAAGKGPRRRLERDPGSAVEKVGEISTSISAMIAITTIISIRVKPRPPMALTSW